MKAGKSSSRPRKRKPNNPEQKPCKRHPKLTEKVIAEARDAVDRAVGIVRTVAASICLHYFRLRGIDDHDARRHIVQDVIWNAFVHLHNPSATPESLTGVMDRAADRHCRRYERIRARVAVPAGGESDSAEEGGSAGDLLGHMAADQPLPDELLVEKRGWAKLVELAAEALARFQQSSAHYYRVFLHVYELAAGAPEDAGDGPPPSDDARKRCLAGYRDEVMALCEERFFNLPTEHPDLKLYGAIYMYLNGSRVKGSQRLTRFIELLLSHLEYMETLQLDAE